MSVHKVINALKADLSSYVITDEEKACEILLRSRMAVFLDTCFISSLQALGDKQLEDILLNVVDKANAQKIVFVITELVLYEARDPRTNTVQDYVKRIVNIAEKNDVPVVLINEENIHEVLLKFSGAGVNWWNDVFLERLKENKANLTKLMVVIKTDEESVLNDSFEVTKAQLKDVGFIKDTIGHIKERKSDKDSIAEELICIVVFFLFEGFMNVPNKKVLFCSNDNEALARVRMAIKTSYGTKTSFENVHFFTLIQFMIAQGILTDKGTVLGILKKTMAPRILVVEKEELPFCETEQMMTLEEIVDGMFDGKVYSYRGNR